MAFAGYTNGVARSHEVALVNMARRFATLLWLSAALAAVQTLPTSDKSGSENDLMTSIYADCLKKESVSCIKYKVFTYVDKMLADKEDITLSEGITVVKTSNAEEGAPRSVRRMYSASYARTRLSEKSELAPFHARIERASVMVERYRREPALGSN